MNILVMPVVIVIIGFLVFPTGSHDPLLIPVKKQTKTLQNDIKIENVLH